MIRIKSLVAQGMVLMIFLSLLAPVSFTQAQACPASGTTPTPSQTFCNPSTTYFVDLEGGNTFKNLFLFIIESILGIVGILAILFIVIGGYQYITSGGSDEQAEIGKKTLTNAIIGLIIVILSYSIVLVIINAVHGNVGS
jgi:hypothetical protein